MKAKILVYVLLALILANIHLADAQQQGKVPRIGVLVTGPIFITRFKSFQEGLRDLGYVEASSRGRAGACKG
jgi:hypothetical protein